MTSSLSWVFTLNVITHHPGILNFSPCTTYSPGIDPSVTSGIVGRPWPCSGISPLSTTSAFFRGRPSAVSTLNFQLMILPTGIGMTSLAYEALYSFFTDSRATDVSTSAGAEECIILCPSCDIDEDPLTS